MDIRSIRGKVYIRLETKEEFNKYGIENYKHHDHFLCDHCYLIWRGPGWYTFYEDIEYGAWEAHHMSCATTVQIRQNHQAEIEDLKAKIKALEELEKS